MGIISKQNKITNQEEKKPFIGTIDEAPKYTVDNPYLIRGYRCNFNTPKLAFMSIFQCHNETCNIWTHMLPFFGSILCYIYTWIYQQPPFISLLDGGDQYNSVQTSKQIGRQISMKSIEFFWATAIYLFGCSTMYHTLFCVKSSYNKFLLRMDYSGICLIASGGVIPAIHYGFYCQQNLMQNYVNLCLGMSLIVWILSLIDLIHQQQYFILKISMYCTFFTMMFIPLIHLVVFNAGGLDFYNAEFWFLITIINQIFGIFIYMMRIPEKYFPNKFDYILCSHQIWHIFVITSLFSQYLVVISIFIDRSHHQCK